MIKEIFIRNSYKRNWIDQNNVVFGYDDYQQCCEDFRWGVFNMDGTPLTENPDGLPYHFDFNAGALEHFPEDWSKDAINKAVQPMIGEAWFSDITDVVVVKLIPDDNNGSSLYFVCVNKHNGWYYHDFSFGENREKKGDEDED